MSPKPRAASLWAAAALLTLATACGDAGAEAVAPASGATTQSSRATRVVVSHAPERNVSLELSLPGEVVGARDATLAAALGGYVEAVLVHGGERVRKGQTIARIDTEIYTATADQAEARLDLARSELDRIERMGDLASPSQLERAQVDVRIADATLRQAKAQVRRAFVSAPFDGVIGATFVEAGEVAGPGTPVARLVQTDSVRVKLTVADRDVVSLRSGMPVQVNAAAYSGALPGHITHIGAAADLSTRAFPVEVAVDNADGKLLPGMIARVDLSAPVSGQAVIVPQDWVVTRLEGAGVYIEADGVAQWRPVDLGPVVHDEIIIESGVKAGDRVITTGHRELVDGDAVIVSRVEDGGA